MTIKLKDNDMNDKQIYLEILKLMESLVNLIHKSTTCSASIMTVDHDKYQNAYLKSLEENIGKINELRVNIME